MDCHGRDAFIVAVPSVTIRAGRGAERPLFRRSSSPHQHVFRRLRFRNEYFARGCLSLCDGRSGRLSRSYRKAECGLGFSGRHRSLGISRRAEIGGRMNMGPLPIRDWPRRLHSKDPKDSPMGQMSLSYGGRWSDHSRVSYGRADPQQLAAPDRHSREIQSSRQIHVLGRL